MQTGNQITIFLLVTTFLILVLLGSVITGIYFFQKKKILFQKHLAITKLEIQEETFQNISREIHDNIGLSLTLAKLHLNTLTLDQSQTISPNIMSSIELITQAINDLSDISKSLNSDAIRTQGFLNVLKQNLERIKKSGKYEISLEIEGQPVFMDEQTELVLYRITQEALNNIIKHSNASEIQFKLHYTETYLRLSIHDNGIGINWAQLEKTKSKRIMAGLNNMKARIKIVNGTCIIHSDDSGTTVIVTAPI